MFISAASAGGPLRAELDGGGNSDWVDVEILVENSAGGQTVVHSERVFVGDTPVEYIGPQIEPQWKGGALRLRIKDIVSPTVGEGPAIADDSTKVRNS